MDTNTSTGVQPTERELLLQHVQRLAAALRGSDPVDAMLLQPGFLVRAQAD